MGGGMGLGGYGPVELVVSSVEDVGGAGGRRSGVRKMSEEDVVKGVEVGERERERRERKRRERERREREREREREKEAEKETC